MQDRQANNESIFSPSMWQQVVDEENSTHWDFTENNVLLHINTYNTR